MSASNIVELVEYSERSVAVFGQTQPYKSHFMDIGGKFNPALTKQGQKQPGWIFSKKQQAVVADLVNKICKGQVSPSPSQLSSSTASSGSAAYVDRRDFMALLSRVEYLEQSIGLIEKHLLGTTHSLKTLAEAPPVVIDIEEDEREDDSQPRTRLLKKKDNI